MADPKELSDAVWSGDLATVDALLVAGVDPNIAEEDRWPPLYLAIETGHKEIILRLIAAGADINRELEKGFTRLHTPLMWRVTLHGRDLGSPTKHRLS